MFNPTLKVNTEQRLVYSTPVGFRIMFGVIAAFLVVSVASASADAGTRLDQWPPVVLGFIAICLAATAYLERWTFDKEAGVMERAVGLLFWHTSKETPLTDLKCVVLREPGMTYEERPGLARAITRRTTILGIEDAHGVTHPLDMVKGSGIAGPRAVAEQVAAFCDIPIEDTAYRDSTAADPQAPT